MSSWLILSFEILGVGSRSRVDNYRVHCVKDLLHLFDIIRRLTDTKQNLSKLKFLAIFKHGNGMT